MEVNPDNMLVKSLPSFVFGGINEHAVSNCTHTHIHTHTYIIL